jgi:hypothetical protein
MRQVVSVVVVCAALFLGGCWGPKQALNPPRLVTADETDMSIQLFMQATLLLAHYYHFQTIQYSDFQSRASSAGLSTLPFMPPETVRATPELIGLIENPKNTPEYLDTLANYMVKTYGYKPVVKYYIRTGLRASQLICRNYLLRLEENNRYLDFLRNELGVGYTLATSVLLATHANNTLTNAFAISRSFADNAITAYEEYRFLTVDREAARALVETVQAKYAEFFMKHVDLASADSTDPSGGFTFSDALHAVSIIEYQCTREGINALLTRSVNNTPTNINIDMTTGSIIFDSAKNVTAAADMPVPKANPAATPPTGEKSAQQNPQQQTPQKQKPTKPAGPAQPAAETDAQVMAILNTFTKTGNATQQATNKGNLASMLQEPSYVKAVGSAGIDDVLNKPEFKEVRKQMLDEARATKLIQ